MRLLVALFLVVSTFCSSQELKELRLDYPKANLDEVVTDELHEKLSAVSKEDDKTLVAFRGAVTTLKAKFAKGFKDKKTYFKEGALLLEYAVEQESNNIEIRCLRLGVQENAPRIVGYKKNIEEDKQFILDHYKSYTDADVRKFVKGYVLLSDVFTEAEKQLF
ncbi:hypothetical protein [Maribacter sp. 2308TA10-17]|uniref:hypothetical protein n=1 Tax=Maribacter sp. 2308TA10-17 TaxID=3386276 RepID=UPI0039BD01A2